MRSRQSPTPADCRWRSCTSQLTSTAVACPTLHPVTSTAACSTCRDGVACDRPATLAALGPACGSPNMTALAKPLAPPPLGPSACGSPDVTALARLLALPPSAGCRLGTAALRNPFALRATASGLLSWEPSLRSSADSARLLSSPEGRFPLDRLLARLPSE